MTTKKKTNIKHRYPFQYRGNLFWLIFFLILFFPIAIVLIIKNAGIIKNKKYLALSYRGRYGWLIFWSIFFFPIAIILVILKGVDIVEED